jgi:N-acetylmuramic acid 6-phosphate etherase
VTNPAITERERGELDDLDLRSTEELIALVNRDDETVARAVAEASPQIVAAIEAIVGRLAQGGRLVYVGAGSSGLLAALDASEIAPTFGSDKVVALLADGPQTTGNPTVDDEDDAEAGIVAIKRATIGPQDAVVGVAASGNTRFTIGAITESASRGALTVALVCNPGSPLAEAADLEICVPTGPEIVAGSTRMKGGTAQKLVLNMLSTISMVRLGRTYGNLMVNVVATNEKLRARARRAVSLATGAADADVESALEAAGGNAPVAIVSLLASVDPGVAQHHLEESSGAVRRAVEAARTSRTLTLSPPGVASISPEGAQT